MVRGIGISKTASEGSVEGERKRGRKRLCVEMDGNSSCIRDLSSGRIPHDDDDDGSGNPQTLLRMHYYFLR